MHTLRGVEFFGCSPPSIHNAPPPWQGLSLPLPCFPFLLPAGLAWTLPTAQWRGRFPMRRPTAARTDSSCHGVQSKGSERGIRMTSRGLNPPSQKESQGPAGRPLTRPSSPNLDAALGCGAQGSVSKETWAHIALFADFWHCLPQSYLRDLNPGLLRDMQKY